MSGRERYLVERIDRSKEHAGSKAERSARSIHLKRLARRTVSTMLADLDREEQAIILGDVLDIVAERLHPLIGRTEAATAFNSRAADVCATFRLGRAITRESAEHTFARLQANDDERGPK